MTSVVGVHELQQTIAAQISRLSGSDARKALMQGGMLVERRAKQNVRKQHLIDTGDLRDSIEAEPVSDHLVQIGTAQVYAAIHEFGGVIRPKSSKYLAIPLTSAAKGVPGPRDYPGTLRFVPGNNGGVLVDEAGDAQYALRTSVTIPARPYLRPAIDENPQEIEDVIGKALWDLLEEGLE
jgi:phage gpG-like protein